MVILSPSLSQVWLVHEFGEFCAVLWTVLCLTMLTTLLIEDGDGVSSWDSYI